MSLIYDTIANLQAANTGGAAIVHVLSYSSGEPFSGATYVKKTSQPSHPGKAQSADGYWYEIASAPLNVKMFGAKGDGSFDNSTAILNAKATCLALGSRELEFPPGTYSAPSLNTSEATTFGTEVIPVGDGVLTGCWGATVHRRSEPRVTVKGNIVPAKHLRRCSLIKNPTIVYVGYSIATVLPGFTLYESETAFAAFKEAFCRDNPGLSPVWVNLAIGAQTWTRFDQTASSNYPDWYPLDTRVIDFDGKSSAFTVGKTLTGGTSAAYGVISKIVDNGTTGRLTLTGVVGAFVDNEPITDNNTTPGAATANGADALRPWIDYVEDYNPDLVVLQFGGPNDEQAFVPYRMLSAVGKLRAFAKVADLIFVTDLVASRLTTGADYGNFSDKTNQEGHDFCANFIRTYALKNDDGLLDYNAQFHILRDGLDPRRSTMARVIDNVAGLVTPYSPAYECHDFQWSVTPATNLVDGGAGLVFRVAPENSNADQFVTISNSGGKVRVKLDGRQLPSGTLTYVDFTSTVNCAAGNVYRVQMKGNRMSVWVGDTLIYEDSVVRLGGIYVPQVKMSDGGAMTFTGTFDRGGYRQAMPSLLDHELFPSADSNQINHGGPGLVEDVYRAVLALTNLAVTAAAPPLTKTITTGGTVTLATACEEIIYVNLPAGTSLTLNLPPSANRRADITVVDLGKTAKRSPIVMNPNGSETMTGRRVIDWPGGVTRWRPRDDGLGYVAVGQNNMLAA